MDHSSSRGGINKTLSVPSFAFEHTSFNRSIDWNSLNRRVLHKTFAKNMHPSMSRMQSSLGTQSGGGEVGGGGMGGGGGGAGKHD